MKKASLLFAVGFCVLMLDRTASGQTTYTWNQFLGSTDWQVALNWTPARVVPAMNDIIVLNGSTTPTPMITNIPTQTIGEFHLINSALATISATAGAPATLTIALGAATNDFEIDSTSFLIVTGATANPLTITLSAMAIGSVSGQMTFTGTSSVAHRLTAASASAITFQNGSAFFAGTNFNGNAFGTTSLNSVIFASGSQYVFNAGSDPFGAGQPSSVVVFQSGSSYIHQSILTPSFSGRTYANFELNAGAANITVTGGSAVSIDNLTITAGTLNFNMTGTPGHAIKGNISVTGRLNFSPAIAGTVNLNGSSPQLISGSGTLTSTANQTIAVTNASGVTLGRNLSLGGPLSISGILDQGASFNLTASASPTAITIASGGLLRNLGTGDLTLGGNVANNGTVNLNGGGVTCGDADSILMRSSVAGTQRSWSGTGVFDFIDVDLQDQTSGLPLIAVSSTDSGNNVGWTFQSACGPSAARLSTFTARHYEDGTVLLEWQTGFEVDNLGYNIYRDEGGKRARITPGMIAGSALLTGPGISLKSGRSYAWTDSLADGKQSSYWLEEVGLNGASTWHGPFGAVRARQGEQLPPGGRGRAVLLSGLTADSARQIQATPVARAAKPVVTTAAGLAVQSDLAGRSALKLSVTGEGWYRVSARELIEAGLDSGTDPRNLRLYADGQEQAFIVKGEEDGRLDPLDAVEFYGIGLDTAATNARVYWLTAGSQPGRRVQQIKGKGSRLASSSAPYAVERKDRAIYFSGLRNGGKENFFGAVIAKNPVDQMIRVEHLDTASPGDVAIEVALQGVTAVAHRVNVELNGTAGGELTFLGQAEGLGTFSLPRAALKEGENTVRLTPAGAESDVSLVNYIRITYPHTFTADNNALRFNLPNKQQVTIDGFSSPAIRVLDITDPNDIRQVSARVQQQGYGYSVTVSAPKPGGRLLWALADDQAKQVVAITSNRTSNLRSAENAADFVIVAHRDFLESVKPLQSLREGQGLKVSVIDVEDVYDEFSYGDKSPQAIKDFLSFAKTNWRTAPRFALFVGDASLDPKNYLGRGDYDFVPTRLIDTLLMETASDEWLADFDGDGLAEMALGRLPVRTAAEASRIIDKIVSYEIAPRTHGVLLVSDVNDGVDFQSQLDGVRTVVPADVSVAQIDRGILGTAAAKSLLIESLNRGLGIVSYFGHGNIDQWRGDLLTSSDVAVLENGDKRPVVFAITCLNGYFQDPALDSLAESLLKAERGGAVAVWASSGMCDAGAQALMDREMFRIIFAGDGSSVGAVTLGEAAMNAKRSISDVDVRLTYILFGDPTARIK